jgi:hypothetical protein
LLVRDRVGGAYSGRDGGSGLMVQVKCVEAVDRSRAKVYFPFPTEAIEDEGWCDSLLLSLISFVEAHSAGTIHFFIASHLLNEILYKPSRSSHDEESRENPSPRRQPLIQDP